MKKLILSIVVAGVMSSASAAIDLTGTPSDVTEDGVTTRQFSFRCDGGKITFEPPPQWTFSGAKTRAQVTPQNKSFAEGVIETSPLPAPQPIDAAAIAAFKQQLVASLPVGSQGIELVSEAENSTTPGGHPSYEVVFVYKTMGKTFQRSALLVHSPTDRLSFRFSAEKEDFALLITPFRRSIMSWQFVADKPPQPQAGS